MRAFRLFFVLVAILGIGFHATNGFARGVRRPSRSSTPENSQEKWIGDLAVDVVVTDDMGRPVPYAEVWRRIDPYCRSRGTYHPSEVSLGYFERQVARYKDVAEFIRKDYDWALRGFVVGPLHILDLADPQGRTSEVIELNGVNKRPASVQVTYAGLAYGYFPATRTTDVGPEISRIQLRLALRRDPAIEISSPLIQRANATRFEAIERSRGTENEERIRIPRPISFQLRELARENQQREKLRTNLIQLAEQTAAGGGRVVASRSLCLALQIPSVDVHSSGYKSEGQHSERNLNLLRRAIQIDPNNWYAQMKLLYFAPPVDRIQRIQQTEALLAKGPTESFWPEIYMRHEKDLHIAGDHERSKAVFDWFVNFEPDHYDNQGMFLKRKRVRHLSLEQFEDEIVKRAPNMKDEYGHYPMDYAVWAGRRDFVEWLLNHGVTTFPQSILFKATSSRDAAFIEYLLSLDQSVTLIQTSEIEREVRHDGWAMHPEDSDVLKVLGQAWQKRD